MSVRQNLENIEAQVKAICHNVGRNPEEVTLLPVSKGKSIESIKEVHICGYTSFAESKVQEAHEKSKQLKALNLKWCMVGPLQTNKAKIVAQFVTELHTLDRLKLAVELEKQLQTQGRSLDVLIQVNTSGEVQKNGLALNEVLDFAKQLRVFSCLNIKGLMTIAVNSDDKEQVRSCFKALKNLQTHLRDQALEGLNWDVLSMGMSGDFELAIEEGATELRIGQAIFGSR